MRRAAPRHGRLTKIVERVARGRLVIVGDDRRTLVIVAEVESATAHPGDNDLVGQLPDTAARSVAFGSWLLDGIWDRTVALRPIQREVHRVPRDLVGDRLALDLIGIEQPRVGPAFDHAG